MFEQAADASARRVEFDFQLPASRVTTDADYKSSFQSGDQVGVFAVKNGETLQASGNYIQNLCLTYDGTSWNVTGGNAAYYPADGTALDFYAYYPYQEEADPTALTLTVQADQSADPYRMNDLLQASVKNQETGTVMFAFDHLMALVRVKVAVGDGVPAFTDDFAVSLLNCRSALTVNLGTGTAVAGEATSAVKMYCTDATQAVREYRALVPAQEIKAGTALLSFVQNTAGASFTYKYTPAAAVTFTEAIVNKFNLLLTAQAAEIIGGEGNANGWDNEGEEPGQTPLEPSEIKSYSVGDLYPEENPEGIIFEIGADGVSAKIFSLDEKQDRWGDASVLESENGVEGASEDDGEIFTRNLTAKRQGQGNWAQNGYSLFAWLLETKNGGNAEGGWYMPAKNEALAIYNVGKDVIDARLSAAGGTEFTWTGRLVTCTEISADKVYCINLADGSVLTDKTKTDTYNRLRAVKKVTLPQE